MALYTYSTKIDGRRWLFRLWGSRLTIVWLIARLVWRLKPTDEVSVHRLPEEL